MDVNKAFQILQMFYQEVLKVLIKRYTQCILVRNCECKYNFVCLFKKIATGYIDS